MITFEPSDYPNPKLEVFAEEISVAVRKYKSRIAILNTLLRQSGSSLQRYRLVFNKWKMPLNKRKSPPDLLEFASLLDQFDTICTNDEEWNKLRGVIAEKIFEPYFEQKHMDALEKGYGVKVLIDNVPVKYRPKQITPTDSPRQSVDAGAWNGEHAEFVEIKFSPTAFQIKDINYLKLLETCLDEKHIQHTIYLATFNDIEFTKSVLQADNLIDDSTKFKMLGVSDFL